LYFVHEVGYNSSNSAGAYSQWHEEFTPNPAVGYYGRGPIQLSWNYNYGQFSKFLFNDKNILLDNPNLLQEDGVLAFQSAIWFWMMPQCPKPSCHQVMHDLWAPQAGEYPTGKMYTRGFAHTNNIINGGLECRATSTAAFTEKVLLRSALYQYYLGILGFGPEDLLLENTPPYSTLCFESPDQAMQDYLSCSLEPTLSTQSRDRGQIQIFPNPATDYLTLRAKDPIDKVEIFNAWGQLVWQASPGAPEWVLNLSTLTTGVYTLKIFSKNTVTTRQWVLKS
jgi:basic endochitinase B